MFEIYFKYTKDTEEMKKIIQNLQNEIKILRKEIASQLRDTFSDSSTSFNYEKSIKGSDINIKTKDGIKQLINC